jgi:hypothetical protein
MGWSKDESLARCNKKYDETVGIKVTKLDREMDFDNISLLEPKRIFGAHVYVEIVNFSSIVGDKLDIGCEPDLLRRLHLHSRELTRVVEHDFGAAKVHFQGPKLHAVVFRPIDDPEAIARCALAIAAASKQTVEDVMNELFGDDPWEVAVGVDLGDAVATKNNLRGDQELLFLGEPANEAAKIISAGILVTGNVADAAPADLNEDLIETGTGRYSFEPSKETLADLVEDAGWEWDPETSRARVKDDFEQYPPDSVGVSGVSGKIDKDRLSLANSKQVVGIPIYSDVDGFTAYVKEASDSGDDDLVEAIRAFHVIRAEMRYNIVEDQSGRPGLRVQYRGDNVVALAFLPVDDEAAISLRAVEIGTGLNASITHTLPIVLGDEAVHPVATGMALGTVLVSKLGEHGERDVVCIGPAATDAEKYQERLAGNEIGIPKAIKVQLPEDVASEFQWRPSAGCYVATDFTADRLDRLVAGAQVDQGAVPRTTGSRRVDLTGRPYLP